jgi:hypothetical protein
LSEEERDVSAAATVEQKKKAFDAARMLFLVTDNAPFNDLSETAIPVQCLPGGSR